MTPAQHIITKCGGGDFSRGITVISEITGVHRSRIHRWTYPKDREGTDGRIPAQHQQTLLDGARARGIDLTASDFFDQPASEEAA